MSRRFAVKTFLIKFSEYRFYVATGFDEEDAISNLFKRDKIHVALDELNKIEISEISGWKTFKVDYDMAIRRIDTVDNL